MSAKTLCKLLLLLSLASCQPVDLASSPTVPIPSPTASPVSIFRTDTVTNTPQSTSTATPNPRDITGYYGVWTITRYEHPRMSVFVTDEDAESQIGKTIELTSTEFRSDDDFLWLENHDCANAAYDWATIDDFTGHAWQALLPRDNPDKREDLLFFDVKCDGNNVIGFEISKTGKLVVFIDGYWFFLDPEISATSALATRFAITYTPTSTPSPLPKFTATYTASLAPTQFYEKYLFDWLIDQQAEAHRGHVIQAGASTMFTSEEHPDTPDSYADLDLSLYTEGKNDLKLSFVKSDPPTYQLLAVSGAKLVPVALSKATLETCRNSDYSSALDFISIETEKGNYFCAVTSDKRFSLFHIDEVNHLSDGSLRISFVTYEKDTDK